MDEQFFNSLEDLRIKQSVDWWTPRGAQYMADHCWQNPGDMAQRKSPGTALIPKIQTASSESQWPSHQTNKSFLYSGRKWYLGCAQCTNASTSRIPERYKVSNDGEGGLLRTHRPSLLFVLQRHGRYQGKETKYSEKAFKSKLNPINDSFKRSVPYIYKSTLTGLCAIWLLTFAVSQNAVQATWVLTSSLKTPLCEAFWWGKSFTGDFWFKLRYALLCVEPAKDLAPGAVALLISETRSERPAVGRWVLFMEFIFVPYRSTYL